MKYKIYFLYKFRFLFLFLSIGTLLPFSVHSQTAKAYLKAGNKSFSKKDYFSAMRYYQQAYEINPKNIEIAYKIGEVAQAFQAFEIAEDYYKKVYYSPKKKSYPLTQFHMGEVRKSMGDYVQAISHFKIYLKEFPNGVNVLKAKSQIEACEWAASVVSEKDAVSVSQLNKRVNTTYSEFGPVLRGDTLFYSSLRYDNTKDEHKPRRKFSKVLLSVKGARGKPMPRGFNDQKYHTAHTTFSANGKIIYYTLCEYITSGEIRCAIYSRKLNSRKRWTKPEKLGKEINAPGFTSTMPTIGYDTLLKKEILLFASNRPGGKGKLDIYYAVANSKGEFSKVYNAKAVNTAEEDATPYYHNTSQTLFFSSKGHKGLGGYDVFSIGFENNKWGSVQHGGYPLNSSYDDVYFSVNTDSTIAYLASNRLGSLYLEKENKTCCNDIYKVQIFKDTTSVPPPEDSLTVPIDTPEIVLIPPKPPVIPEPVPTTLEDFLPLALYFHNDEPDKRTRRTRTRKTYEQTYFDYYALKSTYKREYASPLEEAVRWQAEQDIADFFEFKVRKGYDYLNLFSEILLKRLNQGEQVEIFIKGFTSPRAKSDYNLALGKRRVSSVRNHFDTYREGIFQSYLNQGKLIITERSFGETTAAQNVSDDLYDLRNSIYSIGAASERRVEIVEIKRQ